MRYIGVPYVWGGASPDGFDCSGFVQYTLGGGGGARPANGGRSILRAAAHGRSSPGRFRVLPNVSSGAVTRGIYIGNGYFVNSIGSNVQVSSFASSYFTSRYLGARRVFEYPRSRVKPVVPALSRVRVGMRRRP